MKNTMTNDYKRRIEIYIMWCIRKEDKNLHTSSPRKKMEYFIKRFNAEFNTNYEKVMFPVLQTRISEYLKGLPYDIAYTFSGIIEIAKKLHQTNEFTKKEEDKIIENWFDHLALHILRLCRKYNLILLKDWAGYGILAPDFEEEKPTEDKDELKKERKFRLDTKEKEAIKDFWESDLDIEISTDCDREEYILVLTTDAYYFNYKGFDATRHWNGKRGLNIYSHRKKESIIAVDCDDGFQSPEEAIEYIESLSQEEISNIYNGEYEEQIEY